MTIAILFVLIYSTISVGGIGVVMDNARQLPGYFSFTSSYVEASNSSQPYSLLTIISTLAWGLGYFGMPHILLRFMAIEDEKKLAFSRRIATVWVVISMTIAVLIGVVGYSMSQASAIPVLEGSNSETIIVQIASVLSKHNILTALLAGIILAGILAATMSTADSQLLVAASSISQNLLQDFGKKKIDTKASVKIARITVVIISIVGVILASNPNSSVFEIVSFAWAGFGAAFGPVVLCALFWKRSNKWGALAGMITGGAMIFIWKYGIARLGGVFAIYELLPAFILATIVNIVVSLVTSAPSKDVTDTYEKVMNQ